jgi:hypothetical protein
LIYVVAVVAATVVPLSVPGTKVLESAVNARLAVML